MRVFSFRRSALVVVLSLPLAWMSACGGKSNEDLLASAAAYLEKGEPKSAIIQAKSALQKGDSAQGRYLLGKALLATGDATGADIELGRALAQKHPESQVVPLLAQAMLALGRDKEVIERFGARALDVPLAQAQMKTALAAAYARQSNMTASAKAIDEALQADSKFVPAMLMRARMLAAQGQGDPALAQIENALAAKPNDHDALMLKGDVLVRVKGDQAAAKQAYQAALAAVPQSLGAYTSLVTMAMSQRDFKGAEALIGSMKQVKAIASQPQVLYLETRLAMASGNLASAKDLSSQLLKASPEHPLTLELVGLIAFESKDWPQALAHLQNAVKARPDLLQARLGLSRTHLRMAQPAKALTTLQPLLDAKAPVGDAYALAGEAHLQLNELAKAETMFKLAGQQDPQNVSGRTALALLKLQQGDARAAVLELNDIANVDKGTAADLALVTTLLRTGEYAAARKAAGRLLRKMPDKPVPHHLRGLAQLGAKQLADARGSFDQALEADAAYFPALAQLVRLDVEDGQADRAEQRVEKYLQAQRGHGEATLLHAQLRRRAGASAADLSKIFEDAIKVNPTDAALRLGLIQQLAAQGRKDLALSAAQSAVAAFPNHAQLVDALGRAQVASGEQAQGLATFGKLASLQADSPLGHLRTAETQMAAKNYGAARTSLSRAASVAGDAPEIHARRAALEVADGKPTAALAIARDVQKRHPKLAIGHAIEGDVHAAGGHWPAAVSAYRVGLQRQASTPVAIKLHSALVRAGKTADAESAAKAWMKDHPKDSLYLFQLGQAALARGEYERAEARFLAVVERHPRDAAALNNAAWTKLQRGAPGSLELAEKARAIEPSNPAILETLALALSAQGRAGDALPLLQKASALAPGMHGVRLSLAKTYIQLNKKPEAKVELEALKKLGDGFDKQAEVNRLLGAI